MCVWTIIPVKPLNRSKSRLAGVLSEEQRPCFAEAMLRQMLEVVTDVPQVVGTLVISRDTKVLSIAREYGAKTVQESGSPDLNPALLRATEVVRAWGCDGVLVLPADLPFISSEDVINIVEQGRHEPVVVIAPDRERDGTNALFMRPPGSISYAYGPGSFMRHVIQARTLGIEVKEYESERVLLDIDSPDDLDEYNLIVGNGDFKSLFVFTPNGRVRGLIDG